MYQCVSNDEDSDAPLTYSDEYIELNERGITINKYVFPFSTKKVIKIEDIRAVEMIEMGRMSGKYTFIGYTWTMVWLHMDRKRPNKTYCITIDDGSFTKIGITPDDPKKVFMIITELRKLCKENEKDKDKESRVNKQKQD